MESIETIEDTLFAIRYVFKIQYGCRVKIKPIPFDLDDERYKTEHPEHEEPQESYSFGLTKRNYDTKTNNIIIGLPKRDDNVYNYEYFRTIEAAIVLLHELNHAAQYEIYYSSDSEEGFNLAVFDILSRNIKEYKISKNAPFYFRNPNEVQSELFALTNAKAILHIVRPDISPKIVEKGILDYANQRLRIDSGVWFFPKPEGKYYQFLDELSESMAQCYSDSFHKKIDVNIRIDDHPSDIMQKLRSPKYITVYNKLMKENDGLIIASSLADFISRENPALKTKYFKNKDVEFKLSLFNTKRQKLIDKISSIKNLIHTDTKTKEPDLK